MPEDLPSKFPLLHSVVRRSSCILDSAANLLVCQMVFEGNVQKFLMLGLDPSFEFCCKGPVRELS